MNGQTTIAVDIGNSAIKVAWNGAHGLELATFRLQHADWTTQLARHVRQHMELSKISDANCDDDSVRHWMIASVNRPATARLQKLVLNEFPQHQWRELTRADIDMPLDIRNPETVGIDRLLGAFAAVRVTGSQSVISIDAGSAVTVDLVRDGRFDGGVILPGIRLQFSVLSQATDRLPPVSGGEGAEPAERLEVPGKDTVSAIRSGVLLGIAGAIDRLISHYMEASDRPFPVVFTGGDAAILQPLLRHASKKVDGLVPLAIMQIANNRAENLQNSGF